MKTDAPVAFSNDPEPLPKFAVVSSILLILCVVCLCFLLAACAPVPTAKPTPANQPQGTPELLQATATREPEQTATATIGYQATIDAALATADASQRLLAEYTAEHERNLEAMALRTQEAFTLQQTALPLGATRDAENRSTDTALQIMHATGTADGQAFQARVPTIVAAMTQAGYTEGREIAGLGVQFALTLASLALAAVAFAFAWRYFNKPYPVDFNIFDLPQQPRPLERPAIPRADGSLDLDTLPPGDPDQFTEYAAYALTGAPLGINAVEGTKIYTRAEYNPVYQWMSKTQRLAPNNGAVGLSDAGKEYCAIWLEQHPHPDPDYTQNTPNNNHNHGNHDYVAGGEVVA